MVNAAGVHKEEEIMQIKEVIVLVFLSVNTYSDIKNSKIILGSAAVFGAVGLICWLVVRDCTLAEAAVALLPGILLLAISKITGEALGYGDGICVLVMGMYIRLWSLIWILVSAMMMAAVWAGVIMVVQGKNKRHEFPFIPFLMAAYLGGIWI